ncbi:MAG: Asp23/Gls24 family envelope stress response protein [Oscillospiraceae bacterium]
MDKRSNKPVGTIKVSDSVIVKMAELAAAEIDGVYCRGQALVPANTRAKMLGSVRAKLNADTTEIHVDIVVLEGYNAVNVAEEVQKSIKSAIQSMTNFTVTKVDVNVAGIKFKESAQ